jgi:hypothetical protein
LLTQGYDDSTILTIFFILCAQIGPLYAALGQQEYLCILPDREDNVVQELAGDVKVPAEEEQKGQSQHKVARFFFVFFF